MNTNRYDNSTTPYTLRQVYQQLRRAVRRGDIEAARRHISASIGLAFSGDLSSLVMAPSPSLHDGLRYRGFKPAERVMLETGIKRIVKFEDIPLQQAARFVESHEEAFQLVVSAPYSKDYLLMRTQRTDRDDPTAMVTIYASRDSGGARLYELEQTSPDDIVGAGKLLQIPPCCISAFEADTTRSRDDQDTVNDDACARLLRSVPSGTGHPALDPLSDLELLGFYPCSLCCPAAIRRARRTYSAMRATYPQIAARCRRELGGETLFFRLPFFARLTKQGDALRPLVNGFPDRLVRRAQAIFAADIARWLASEIETTSILTNSPAAVPGGAANERNGADSATHIRYKEWPSEFFDPI